MNKLSSILKFALALSFMGVSGAVFAAYTSGSTGADGAFSPTASQAIQLPPDGVFNYTSVTIPTGVIITYIKNAANTPVTILATTDVTIAGSINVSATPPISTADISGAGLGGPGGYNGGRGGQPGGGIASWSDGYVSSNVGRAGIGPGGAGPGGIHRTANWCYSTGYADVLGGGGGAYSSAPAANNCVGGNPGVVYGNLTLIPLIGGSGGGGGAGGPILSGSGGGGGGGAILIAASGTISVTGSILANGGTPVSVGTTNGRGAYGGGGSGGAIRLIATSVSGNGVISAVGGTGYADNNTGQNDGAGGNYITFSSATGGAGRIRIETENLARTTATSPAWSGGSPSLAFVPGLPTLTIASIGGVPVPANPSGTGDVALPAGFTNPVDVSFVTSGVTVGSSIKLTITPAKGVTTSATSAPTTGTTSSATATVSVSLLSGPNTIQASVTYTVVASIGNAMSIYALGERVESVTLASTLGSKESTVTLNTVSGKQFVVPASVLAQFPG